MVTHSKVGCCTSCGTLRSQYGAIVHCRYSVSCAVLWQLATQHVAAATQCAYATAACNRVAVPSSSMLFTSYALLLCCNVMSCLFHQKTLCNGDHERPLKIDIYDWDRDGSHDYMVSVTTSLSALLNLDGGRQVSIVAAFFFKHLHFVELCYVCTLAVQPPHCSSIIVTKCSGPCVMISVAMGSCELQQHCSSAVIFV
jgi:hypothetical protein